MKSYTEDNKRLAKNTFTLYFRSLLVMLVGLYVSRALLSTLGVDDFGLYNVVGSIVVLFSFLNSAMTIAAQRYITFEIGNKNLEQANRVFSATFTSQMFLSLMLVLIIEIFGIWFLNNKLNIPEKRLFAANVVFQLSIATFVLNMLLVPYSSTIIAYEKMSFFAYSSIFDALIKLGIVFILKIFGNDKLILYALLITCDSAIILVINYVYCKIKFNTCNYKFFQDKKLYKDLLSFSGWSLFGSATNVFTQNGFVFLINMFYGVSVNAALGIANQINNAVTNFVNSFQTSYRPQIVKSYAQNEMVRVNNLIISTSKISFSLIIMPSLILIFNMPFVLNIWLTDIPPYTVQFCQMILICTIFDAITGSYYAAIMATARIKKYQTAVSISFFLDLLISFVLIKIGVLPYLVLSSRIVTRGIINMIIGLVFIRNLINFPIKEYFKKCILPIALILILTLPLLMFIHGRYNGWQMLFVSMLFTIISYIILIYTVLLSKNEREFFSKLILKIIRK